MPNIYSRGFTLAEIVVTTSILVTLSTLSIVAFISYSRKEALDRNVYMIVSTLRDARSKTLSSVGGSQYGVRIDSDRFTFFKGSSFVSGVSTNREFHFGSTIIATTTVPEFVFYRVTGTVATSGVIRLYSGSDASLGRTINVQGTGLISIQ
jgi:Tfp pilus assembly protein FimT